MALVVHVGAATGEALCQVEHVGLVLSGAAVAKMEDGTEKVMRAATSSTSRPATTAGWSATAVRLAAPHGQRGYAR